jgi:hypothetical protein
MSQVVSSHGVSESLEEVETFDLTSTDDFMSMIQVSVTMHHHGASGNSSNMKQTVSDINTTGTALKSNLTSAEQDLRRHDNMQPSAMANQSQVGNSGMEVTQAGPITVRSLQQQQREQQEVALFVESLAEELVHDFVVRIRSMVNSAWRLPWTTFAYFVLPSTQYLTGRKLHYFDGDPRVWSFVAYTEMLLVVALAIASLSQQRKHWHVPHLQTAEVQLVISLAALAMVARIEAHSSWYLAVTLGLRYLVEGCMLFIALYILPSTLGRCMAEAQILEQRRAAEYFVMEGGGFERISYFQTPPLLDVAIKQQVTQPEISPLLTSLPPMPSLLTILLCILRPLLGFSCALAQHHQSLAMPVCFWLNTWLVVSGLVMTAGLARKIFSQMAQYVPTCEIVALSVGLLPLLGGLQDVGLCSSLNAEAVSYAGMLYLHEVTAMSLFVMYMISQGAHFPTSKVPCLDQSEHVSGWQYWLREVLNPYGVMSSMTASKCSDEGTGNDKRIYHDFHINHDIQKNSGGLHEAA